MEDIGFLVRETNHDANFGEVQHTIINLDSPQVSPCSSDNTTPSHPLLVALCSTLASAGVSTCAVEKAIVSSDWVGRGWAGIIGLSAARVLACGWGLDWPDDRARVSRGGVEIEPLISALLLLICFWERFLTQLARNRFIISGRSCNQPPTNIHFVSGLVQRNCACFTNSSSINCDCFNQSSSLIQLYKDSKISLCPA